jgi:hypothetical protein
MIDRVISEKRAQEEQAKVERDFEYCTLTHWAKWA